MNFPPLDQSKSLPFLFLPGILLGVGRGDLFRFYRPRWLDPLRRFHTFRWFYRPGWLDPLRWFDTSRWFYLLGWFDPLRWIKALRRFNRLRWFKLLGRVDTLRRIRQKGRPSFPS